MRLLQIVEDIAKSEIEKQIMAGNVNLDYEKLYENIIEEVQNQEVNLNNISNSNLSYTMIEFYTLIAMACLYGGIFGMVAINQNLANMSSKGKRVAVAPISKLKLVFSKFGICKLFNSTNWTCIIIHLYNICTKSRLWQ